jgi:hypothetical protein
VERRKNTKKIETGDTTLGKKRGHSTLLGRTGLAERGQQNGHNSTLGPVTIRLNTVGHRYWYVPVVVQGS